LSFIRTDAGEYVFGMGKIMSDERDGLHWKLNREEKAGNKNKIKSIRE